MPRREDRAMVDQMEQEAEALPRLGAQFTPANGLWAHQKLTWRGGWIIAARNVEDPKAVEEIAFCRRAAEAAQRFQQARREDCEPGWVVEVSRAVIGGWVLVDRAPWLRFTNVSDQNPNHETVWGQNGEPIGMTWPDRPGSWWLLIRNPEKDRPDEIAFSHPSRSRDGLHRTRTKAIATAMALAPETAVPADDRWLQEWPESVKRFIDANIATTFRLDVLLLGPTGTPCTVPGCDEEAEVRIARSGTDVGVEARMACNGHAGEAMARQTMGGAGPTPDA